MTTMTASLHDPLKDRASKIAELQRLIDEGLTSGISARTPEKIRQLGRDRLGRVLAHQDIKLMTIAGRLDQQVSISVEVQPRGGGRVSG